MHCRKVIRSVLKTSKWCLDGRFMSYSQFPRMADDLKIRRESTVLAAPRTHKSPLPGPQQQQQQQQQLHSNSNNNANGFSNLKTQTQKPENINNNDDDELFENLVFSPYGRQRAKDQDKNRIAREDAEFNECIQTLATLFSNWETIKNSIWYAKDNSKLNTIKFLERSGLPLSTVEQQLSIIHVAGTKGKGSTCALVDSILRQYGAKTGFFSSPHLLSTNERIRINGDPLPKNKFTHHFWQVFNRLSEQREHELDMPTFFMFLTILSFHVFIAEKVDVLILEVGIGGESDCTNVVRNVKTIGITSLALEHTDLLGKTLKEIAWQKAGIIKPDSHVYTHVQQPECLKVIYERAAEKNAKIIEVLSTEAYFNYNLYGDYLDSCNDYVRLNGALAIQLSYDWLRQTTGPLHQNNAVNEPKMSAEVLRGLANAHWPGRCQLVAYRNMRIHLDGAHTVESMRICCDWYLKSIKLSADNPKILIFNRTGESDPLPILRVIDESCDFDMICFVPNLSNPAKNDPNQTTLYFPADEQRKRAKSIAIIWEQLCAAKNQTNQGQMYNTLLDAFTEMRLRYPQDIELDVLVTGSIHLLGAAISALNDFQTKPSIEIDDWVSSSGSKLENLSKS
ncbi:hypothetical protein ACLKA6_016300 [Drosophila palustris]